MARETYFKHLFVLVGFLLLNFIMLSAPDTAQAASKEIHITTKTYNGGKAIQDAFELQKGNSPSYDMLTVTIEPGTYWITDALTVYSNTKIIAKNGAVIYYTRNSKLPKPSGRAPLISNYCEGKRGYQGAGNIMIEGGVWDFQGHATGAHAGVTMEAFRFAHSQNIVVRNVTMQNLYRSHFLTLEGVQHVQVKNCTFQNYSNRTEKKEAIHIDCMHNDSMAPSNQNNVIYDDTICHYISITNCAFRRVPRGVGTHIAVAGLYPSHIDILYNSFEDITYEAIKAYHYRDVKIVGNRITRAGEGIKCYLYSADSDKDEEGLSNYLGALPGVATQAVPTNLNVTIQWNVIRDITDAKVGFGIHLVGVPGRILSGANISYNNIANAGQAVATKKTAIYVKYGNLVRVVGNQIVNAGETGILFSNATNIVARNNDVKGTKRNGMTAQFCTGVTYYKNRIWNAGRRGVYIKNTSNAILSYNSVENDKLGSYIVNTNSSQVELRCNQSFLSKKNAISISGCARAIVKKNTVYKPRRYGIYVYKSDFSKIEKNSVQKSKSTAIIASTSSGIVVDKNQITQTGKYGILFTSAKKSYAKNNKIEKTKRNAIIFSANSKNKKQNLNLSHIRAKKGTKEICGYAYKSMKVKVTIGKKKKTVKTKKNGTFVVKVKKLKKKKKVVIQLTDKKKNVMTKTVTVK